MARPLHILAPTRYPGYFNLPHGSRHRLSIRDFLPLNKVSPRIEGITVFNPLPLQRFDLVHAFNRIPLGSTPFVINFESHLPRAFGHENDALFRWMKKTLAGPRCRRIVAISDYARRQFVRQHEGQAEAAALFAKLEVRYPNIVLPVDLQPFDAAGPLRLLFVGNHFARKGGCVALRLAELAAERGLPITLDIVSSFETGSWVDPLRPAFFDADRARLAALPTVTHQGSLPNASVRALMRQAHFLLLPTFSDTFGYSAIEAMAEGTPVIGTDQAALPEFITDGQNGILLSLEKDAIGEWRHVWRSDRGTPAYEEFFQAEVERLAEEAFGKIQALAGTQAYDTMRSNGWATAQAMFGAAPARDYWDELYEAAV